MHVMRRIFSQYNPHENNPDCRFEAILYNKVPKNFANYFEKPPCVRAQLWDQFVNKNPDKANLVPVAVRGYDELNDRSKLCLAGHLEIIKNHKMLTDKIDSLKYNIEKKIKDKILELKQIQIDLSYRLLVIIKTYIIMSQRQQRQELQQVATTQQGLTEENRLLVAVISGLTLGEKEMKQRLDILMRETRGLHYIMANINKSMLEVVNAGGYNENNMDLTSSNGVDKGNYDDIIDKPNNMKAMFNFLTDQTKIISHLTKSVQKDLDDLNVIKNGIIAAKKTVYF